MSRKLAPEQLAAQARIVAAPQIRETVVDRTFGLPRRLYAATVALYLGFVGALGLGLSSPGLAIPLAIFAFFIVAGFGVPAMWTRIGPDDATRPLAWSRFADEGIATLTGRVGARDAVAQILLLPVLIFLWALTVLVIAALV